MIKICRSGHKWMWVQFIFIKLHQLYDQNVFSPPTLVQKINHCVKILFIKMPELTLCVCVCVCVLSLAAGSRIQSSSTSPALGTSAWCSCWTSPCSWWWCCRSAAVMANAATVHWEKRWTFNLAYPILHQRELYVTSPNKTFPCDLSVHQNLFNLWNSTRVSSKVQSVESRLVHWKWPFS